MILIGILIGFILGLPIGFIKWKKKTIPVVEKYIRRGILNKEFRINENGGVKITVHVQYEIGELESTDKLSKIEVIVVIPSQSEYLTDFYKKKFTELINKSWIESANINWITTASDIRNKKIDQVLNQILHNHLLYVHKFLQ
jgi:hypothetical protein